jgi:signal transduction histidine kinase/ligand-binding sensor domain-containing protein
MGRFLQRAGWLAGVAVMLQLTADLHGPAAWAAPRRMTEFHHRMWTSDNGIGAVFDIQQASNGYLWLTTSTGVFRFDGVRFQSVEEVTNGAIQDSEIHSAFLSSSGGVWLKTRAAGLLFWKNDRLTAIRDRRCTPALPLEGLTENPDGSLWVQGSSGFFHLRESSCEPVGPEQGYPGGFPAAILVDRKGTVWVRTLAGDILFLAPGESKFQPLGYFAGTVSAAFVPATPAHNAFLHEAPDGTIWLSDDYGLRQVTNKLGAPVLPSQPVIGHKENLQFGDFTFASDGSLWAVTDKGVRRFDKILEWRTTHPTAEVPSESFTVDQGLSSNTAWKVFIDHEGSVWVGTNSGLDQLRRTALTALALPQTEEHDFSVVAGDRGSVWIGNNSLPVTHVSADGTFTTFPETHGTICLRRDRNGAIWSADVPSKLWRNSGTGFALLPYPEEKIGPVISLAFDRNDDVWIITGIGGTYHFSHGEWSRQNEVLGKGPGIIGAMASDATGNVWFGFSNKLIRWDGSNYLRFSFPDGTPGASETTMSVRDDHVWLAGSGGIELFTNGRFYLLHWKDKNLPGRVTGVLETETGDLWANGSSGITHVLPAELARWIREPASEISAEHLDARDGLPGFSAERIPEPSITQSPNGRLWFATTKGVAWLDPEKVQENRNLLAPPVMVSSISFNGKTHMDSTNLTLPAHTDKLEIDYTALSLVMPERVLFRYRLDGVDKEWQDAGTRRQAFYTSLPPGHYRFQVIASNNDGVWNDAGAAVAFDIAPAFYQTRWFIALCVVSAMALLYMLYLLRVRQLARQFEVRMEERVGERTRIARELHDTLLQSFQASLMKFYAVTRQLWDRPELQKILGAVIDQAAEAVNEGRKAVQGLRSSTVITNDLARAIRALGAQISSAQGSNSPEFQVQVEGASRDLAPILRDDVYHIAAEAIRNAFQHAQSRRIDVEIRYGQRELRLHIRDDGKGIDPQILEAGARDGHYGLPGLHERAQLARGKLTVCSEPGSGTDIELSIPASAAYAPASGRRANPRAKSAS